MTIVVNVRKPLGEMYFSSYFWKCAISCACSAVINCWVDLIFDVWSENIFLHGVVFFVLAKMICHYRDL